MTKKNNPILSLETLVEVVKICSKTGVSQRKKVMEYRKAVELKNSNGFYYRIYQIGYSS